MALPGVAAFRKAACGVAKVAHDDTARDDGWAAHGSDPNWNSAADGLPELATPLPRAIRSGATRRVGGAHAPAAQACYGIGRQGCNTLVYVRARLEGGPTLRLSVWEDLVITSVSRLLAHTHHARHAGRIPAGMRTIKRTRKDRLLAKSLPSVITP